MKIHYVTGSRADFGLMRDCLRKIAAATDQSLGLIVTGQALIGRYGNVEAEISDAGIEILHRIPVTLSGADHAEMAAAFAEEARGLAKFWGSSPPDLVLLLGDRSEMLAAATIAYHLCVPIAHLHGGERSGTLDEAFRHSISKLATYHFVATEDSRRRLLRMGEDDERIVVVGAPGLVQLSHVPQRNRSWLAARFNMPTDKPVALVLFHPVVQEREDMGRQTEMVLDAVRRSGLRAIVLRPNSDSGGAQIDCSISERAGREHLVVLEHLNREDFLEVLSASDVLIGNSSSGIIETATLGTPCVNVGSRQDGRLRNQNVIDCPQGEVALIMQAIVRALKLSPPFRNVYGDGRADDRLLAAIRRLEAAPCRQQKENAY